MNRNVDEERAPKGESRRAGEGASPRRPGRETGPSRGRGQRAGLTRDVVLAAARRIVERDGLDRLTMRRLAGELGVMPNTLYSHTASKAALVDDLLDGLLGDVEVPDPDACDWRDGLVALMGSARRLLLAHPAFVPAFLSRPTLGPNAQRLGEVTFELLRRGGVHDDLAVDAYRALLIHTLGSAAFEAPRRSDPEPERRRERAEAAFGSAPADELPHIRRLAPRLARHPTDETFVAALRWLLAGIAGAVE